MDKLLSSLLAPIRDLTPRKATELLQFLESADTKQVSRVDIKEIFDRLEAQVLSIKKEIADNSISRDLVLRIIICSQEGFDMTFAKMVAVKWMVRN